MTLVPDCNTALIDPFFAQTTLSLVLRRDRANDRPELRPLPTLDRKSRGEICSIPGVGDTVYFGPEAEFFIFDDVRFDTAMNKGFYYIDSAEGAYNTGTEYEIGQSRPSARGQGRLFPRSARGLRAGYPQRNALHHGRHRNRTGKAPPRSGDRAA